jgi:hypothetical protein
MPVASVPVVLRDRLMTDFRAYLCKKTNFIPFEHQAAWWATTDGYELTGLDAQPGDQAVAVRLPDGSTVSRLLRPRSRGRARVVAELGAYKSGKSAGAGIWAAAFAAVPNARVYLVGNEYDMCVPEFEYLLEALCSERGLNQGYRSLQNGRICGPDRAMPSFRPPRTARGCRCSTITGMIMRPFPRGCVIVGFTRM